METKHAVDALGALAHEHRLAIYRLLVEQGPDGLAAGAIGDAVGLAPSSLTFHLQNLHRAGLIVQRRESRSLIYSVDFDAMNGVYDKWIDRENPPARACVEARLADPDLRVEMTAVAAL